MRFGKLFISLFTAVLLLAAVVFGTYEYAWHGDVGITALISSESGTEELRCWENWDHHCYFFLPSFADLSQLRLRTNVSTKVTLNGLEITEDRIWEDLRTDVPYDLCYVYRGKEHHYSLTFLQSRQVPALYIDTATGTMDQIHKEQGAEEPGTLRLYTADGQRNYAGNLQSIKGRGNSTWEYEKKPYSLTLHADADLLGMGAAKRWILLANAIDGTHLRNKIAFDLARDVGLPYTPDSEWVDLYVNGEYAGLYQLCERNEVHAQRVNIDPEGSFLLSQDMEVRFLQKGHPYVKTEGQTALRVHYSDLPQEQLLSIVQSAENAILAEDGVELETGKHWQEYIDLESWAKRFLVEETLGSVDAGTLSQYCYYDGAEGSGKLYAGPLWDMDLTLTAYSANGWMDSLNLLYSLEAEGSWAQALYQDEAFYDYATGLYEETFLPLLTEIREQKLDAYYQQIREAVSMNRIRWNLRDPEEDLKEMKERLGKRIDFLNRIWVEAEDYVIIAVTDYGWKRRCIVKPAGESLPELPEYEDNEITQYEGWYYRDTHIPFDKNQPIYEDIEIQLHYQEIGQPEVSETDLVRQQYRSVPAVIFLGILAAAAAVELQRSRSGHKTKEKQKT